MPLKFQAEEFFAKLSSLDESALLEFVRASQNFSAAEIKTYIDYINQKITKLDLGQALVDCCGTGGDRTDTFNISTAAAIIAAACGSKVCKNGGRSTTSKTGSVDVLEALGLNLNANLETKIQGLNKFNLAFYSSPVSAELLAPIKNLCRKHKELSFLSLLGPLTSPVKLQGQMIGVGQEHWLGLMVDLGTQLIEEGNLSHLIIVDSKIIGKNTRLDELSTASESQIIELKLGYKKEFEFRPQDLDLEISSLEELSGGQSAKENALIIQSILETKASKAKLHTSLLNASCLRLLTNGKSSQNYQEFLENISKEFNQAQKALNSGQVLENWTNLLKLY